MARQSKLATKQQIHVPGRFEDWPSDWQKQARNLVERYEKEMALVADGIRNKKQRRDAIKQLKGTLRQLNAARDSIRSLAHPAGDCVRNEAAAIVARAAQVKHHIPDSRIDPKVDDEHQLCLNLSWQCLVHQADLIDHAIHLSEDAFSMKSRGRPRATEAGLFIYRSANLYLRLMGRKPGLSHQASSPFRRLLDGLKSIFSGRKPATGDDLVYRVVSDWQKRRLPAVKSA